MKYIKIKGKDYKEVMKQLRKEYGEDAIPISHKYVKEGGLFSANLFGKQVCELTAAVQERKGLKKLAEEHKKIDFTVGDNGPVGSDGEDLFASRSGRTSPVASGYTKARDLQNSIDEINSLLGSGTVEDKREERLPALQQRYTNSASKMPRETKSSEGMDKFEREFEEIRTALSLLLEKNDRDESVDTEDDSFSVYRNLLEKNDFDAGESDRIMRRIKKNAVQGEHVDRFSIEKNFKDLVKSKIVTTGPITSNGKKKVIMLLGPTGVGKTTTMAKLGALYALRENKKVSFITIDNYRIAATEQLKKYAEIMGIDIHVITDKDNFKDVINREKSDIILVDTSGRSHRNDIKIAEIRNFASAVDYELEKILCVSASTKKCDLDDVVKAFDVVDVSSIIITKVDETSFVGNVVNVADKYNKPISYITNGQEVPNDIEVATNDGIVDLMMGDGIIA